MIRKSNKKLVDNELLAGDSSFLRDEIYDMTPDVDMTFMNRQMVKLKC